MKAITKDTLREIKKSRMRFFYICAIIALGVAFFCGIKAVSPSMIKTAVNYFAQTNLSDFRLISTYGFRTKDIETISEVDGVEKAIGGYSMDVIMQIADEKQVIKIMSLAEDNQMNAPLLLEGDFPAAANECVIQEPSAKLAGYNIGDEITVLDESHTPDELAHLRERTFTIVGFIQSPQYISIERGNTNISDGTIDGYIMVEPDTFDYERFTEAYIYTDVSANQVNPYSDEYSTAQEQMISSLENVGQEILDDNLSEIKSTALAEIAKNENELNENEETFNEQIQAAHDEIQTQSEALQAGYQAYDNGLITFNTQIADAENQLSAGEQNLQAGQQAYLSGKNALEVQTNNALVQLNQARDAYFAGMNQYLNGRLLLYNQVALGRQQLMNGWKQLGQGYLEYQNGLNTYNLQIEAAQKEIDTGQEQLQAGFSQYDESKREAEKQLGEAEQELQEAQQAYQDGLDAYQNAFNEFQSQIQTAQNQIDTNRKQLESAEKTYTEKYKQYEEGLKAYQEAKKTFEEALPGLQSQIQASQKRIAEIDQELTPLNEKITPLETQIATINQNIEAAKTKIQTTTDSLTQVRTELTSAQNRLAEVIKELEKNPESESLLNEQRELNEKISSLQSQETTLNQTLETQNAELKALEDSLTPIQQQLDPLKQRQTALTTERAGLEQTIGTIQNQITTAQTQFQQQETELNQAKATLDETKASLDSITAQLDAAQAELDQKRLEGQKQLDESLDKLEETDKLLVAYRQELDDQKEKVQIELTNAYNTLIDSANELLKARILLQAQSNVALTQLNEALKVLTQSRDQLIQGEQQLNTEAANAEAELDSAQSQLDQAKKQIDDGSYQLETQRAQGLQQLEQANQTLIAGRAELDRGRTELERQRQAGLEQLRTSLLTLQDGSKKLKEGEEELAKQEQEGQSKINEGRQKIDEAKEQVNDLSRGEWYVYSRDDNPGYSGYQQDAERIDDVGNVFPLFFFLVAALVAFTTMTRMVEEERTQIGTLYALGYSRKQILKKYVTYAGLAALIGATFGWIFGVLVFPRLIFYAYGILYEMPEMILDIPWNIVIISYVVSFACTVGAAVIVALSELRSVPAELMRPKAPKPGKRIFIERIPFLWNRLNFIMKVSMRNIFRYKARFFMTVIGIAGCTALILAGFGLHDAIFTIVPSQFGRIHLYDQSLIIKDTDTDLAQKVEHVLADTRVSAAMPIDQKTINVITEDGNLSAYLIVPSDPKNLSTFISLHERTNRDQPIDLTDDGVVVSEKLATNYGAEPGQEITLEIENKRYKAKVQAQTENYLENYVYMSPALFEKITGSPPVYTLICVNFTDDVSDISQQEQFAADMIATGDYTSAVNIATRVDTANKTMQSLNILVVVMIVSAGMLAFIVLNNLTNINISERIREIATLKVLGFRSKETNNYIFRENIILSIFGTALGIVLGILLLRFIITTVELDIIMFGREIAPMSYVYSVLLTLGFTIIVNYTMIPVIKKVNMVEALKDID